MPTTTQMLARAEDLERRAQALRLAAVEMDDQLQAGKQATIGTHLAQAAALRRQQRATIAPATNGHHPPSTIAQNSETPIDRPALIRAALAGGPQTTPAIQAYLLEHDVPTSRSWTLKQLTDLPEVRKVGTGPTTQWALRRKNAPRSTTPRAATEPTPTETAAADADADLDRDDLLRAALAGGPQTANEVSAYLAARGVPLSHTWIRKQLKALSGVRKLKTSGVKEVHWALAAYRPPATPATPHRSHHRTSREKHFYSPQVKARRTVSAELLAHFTHEPQTTPELRVKGISVDQLKRLGGLLRHGYLKKRPDGWVRTAKVYTP